MLALTKPKIVFCDTTNIGFVREALGILGLVIPIYTFGNVENEAGDVKCVDELLIETGNEDDFL